MKARAALWCSLGVNAALAGLLCWLWTWPRHVEPPRRPVRAAPAPASAPALDMNQAVPVLPSPAAWAPFHWSQIASTDFIRYRDELRALGCPEQTIRDILESEINAHFAQRRRPLIDALQPRFWEVVAQGGRQAFDSFDDTFAALREERRAVLAEVLGERPRDDEGELADSRADWAREYAWLPAGTQEQLASLEERRWRQIRTLEAEMGDRAWTAQDRARRQEIEDAFAQARREALGEHLGDFELRNSGEGRWAENLAGFEPAEAEWRAVAEALREHAAHRQRGQPQRQEGTAGTGRQGNDPADALAQREANEAARQAVLQTALGPERYAEYERASSGAFQQTRRVTRRLGLADETAVQAWEIERAASTAAGELRANAGLDEDRRRNALGEVNLEALRSLRQVLGDEGLRVYREYAGGWLGSLAPAE